MTEIKMHRVVGGSLEECLDKLLEFVMNDQGGEGRKAKPLGEEGLLGLDRRPSDEIARNKGPAKRYKWEPNTLGGKPADEATLLTLRRDLTSLREKVLKGAGRRTVLLELDYTIDQLDNALAEM